VKRWERGGEPGRGRGRKETGRKGERGGEGTGEERPFGFAPPGKKFLATPL